MIALTRGANCGIDMPRLIIEVAGGAPLDVAALLCTESGKVRTDDDFVFYGAPNGPGVRHRPAGGATPDGIEVDLAAVPDGIAKVVVTASLDGSGPPNFSSLPAFSIVARDAATGAAVAQFVPDGLARETALICVEVYRRSGSWKLRAVGQGYESGLAGIATQFGVDIAGDPAPAPAPAAAPLQPPPPAAAAPPPPARPNLQKQTLDNGKVSLQKKQTVSLTKTTGPALRNVRMGLGWDPAKRGKNIDLDASCLLCDASFNVLDKCWFMAKKAAEGAIEHSGDNLTGHGDKDDETIKVDLAAIPANVEWVVFTVTSYKGHKFSDIRNAYCRLIDDATGAELVRFNLTEAQPNTAVLMAALHRAGPTWDMTAMGDFADGRTVSDLTGPSAEALRILTGQ